MGEDPAVIRQQIEQTRDRMSERVDALGYKANVPSRAKDSISEKAQAIKEKFVGAGNQVTNTASGAVEQVSGAASSASEQVSGAVSQVGDAAPSAEDVKQAGRQAVGLAQENPLGLAVGAAAVGFLAGMLIPSTAVEDERLGPIADQVREQVEETAQEAVGRGQQVLSETAQAATQTAKQAISDVSEQAQEVTQQQAEELKSSVQDSVQEVKQTAN
jgi:gas vesicle protein